MYIELEEEQSEEWLAECEDIKVEEDSEEISEDNFLGMEQDEKFQIMELNDKSNLNVS